jgi:hypothetical protein
MHLLNFRFKLIGTLLLTLFPLLTHAEKCQLVDKATVMKAFPETTIFVESGHDSGNCFWMFKPDGSLGIQVVKRQDASELSALYERDRKAFLETFDRSPRTPELGIKAMAALSSEEAEKHEAILLILGKSLMLNIMYSTDSAKPLDEHTLDALEIVGQMAISHEGTASLSIGQCHWFPQKEIERLLETGKPLIQRYDANNCMASSEDNKGVVNIQVIRDIDMERYGMHREKHQQSCTITELPDIAPEAYAFFDCLPRGGASVMQVSLFKNSSKAHVSLLRPDTDSPSQAYIDSMKPLLHHVYDQLY